MEESQGCEEQKAAILLKGGDLPDQRMRET